jgi:hypothetical protein
MTQLHLTILTHFYHPRLREVVDDVVTTCSICQRYKLAGPGYGQLPPREAPLVPWEEVTVDLIGPWQITINGQELIFNALTCIDPVTNLTELVRIPNWSALQIIFSTRRDAL